MPSLVFRRYDMPGEDNVMQSELFLYDIAAMAGAVITEPDGARKKLEPKPLSLVLSCLALPCLVLSCLSSSSFCLGCPRVFSRELSQNSKFKTKH
jgi:hypothetical protein